MADAKTTLVENLQKLNEAVLERLQGLSEYDLRRPLTPTGTNLLGVVKHLASVQAGYFGAVFGRPWTEDMPWFSAEAEINDDMFATPAESSQWIQDFYRRSWEHAVATFAVTELNDKGSVPWWSEDRRETDLHTVLVHMIAETARHAGHIDIVRELIDGKAGRFDGDWSLPGDDEIDWTVYRAKVESAATEAAEG